MAENCEDITLTKMGGLSKKIYRYSTKQKWKINLFKKLWTNRFNFKADIDEEIKEVLPGYKYVMKRMRNRKKVQNAKDESLFTHDEKEFDSFDLSDSLSSDESDFDIEEDEYPKINDHFAGIEVCSWQKREFSTDLSRTDSKSNNLTTQSCTSSDQNSPNEKIKRIALINDGFSETEDCSDGNSIKDENGNKKKDIKQTVLLVV